MLYFTSKYLVTAVLLEKISVVILPHKLQKLKRFFFSTSGFKLTVISLDIHSGTIFVHFWTRYRQLQWKANKCRFHTRNELQIFYFCHGIMREQTTRGTWASENGGECIKMGVNPEQVMHNLCVLFFFNPWVKPERIILNYSFTVWSVVYTGKTVSLSTYLLKYWSMPYLSLYTGIYVSVFKEFYIEY